MRQEINAGLPRIGVGENTIIRRAIIDKNTRIGANVRLINESGIENGEGDGENYFIRDRIIIVPKNAVIPDGTVV
jgi:glucose-1-phosphate adenylyltransferase